TFSILPHLDTFCSIPPRCRRRHQPPRRATPLRNRRVPLADCRATAGRLEAPWRVQACGCCCCGPSKASPVNAARAHLKAARAARRPRTPKECVGTSASLVGCLTCRSRFPSAIRPAQTPYGAQAGQWRRNASALVLQRPMAKYKSRNERRERSVLHGATAKENAMANADNSPDSIVLRHLRNLDQKLDLVTERIEVLTARRGPRRDL